MTMYIGFFLFFMENIFCVNLTMQDLRHARSHRDHMPTDGHNFLSGNFIFQRSFDVSGLSVGGTTFKVNKTEGKQTAITQQNIVPDTLV